MGIFFLNSANRIYGDSELNAVASLLFSTGVFNTQAATHALWKESGDFFISPVGASMNVKALPGMATARLTLTVGSGSEVQRVLFKIDSQLSASVAANPSLANRNDAVVLRIDQSVIDNDELNVNGSNAVSLVVVSGSSATELNDGEISVALSGDPFIRLANILVPQNATEITAGMITDARTLSKMTRSVKVKSDTIGFYGLPVDPSDPEQGDVWFNTTEGILKIYDGGNVISLQNQSFDWGYYGVFGNEETFVPVEENDSVAGLSSNLIQTSDNDGTDVTIMEGAIFQKPASVSNPYLRVKVGNPTNQAGLKFSTYTVDGSKHPDTLVETFDYIAEGDMPKNGYVDINIDDSLYTPGTDYILVAISQLSATSSIIDSKYNQILKSAVTGLTYIKGSVRGYNVGTATVNPLSLTWETYNADVSFVMQILERAEMAIGKTDIAGSINELIQPFTAQSKDITGVVLQKGTSVGSPTGAVNARLYNANGDGEPVGSVLGQGEISQTDWEAVDVGGDVFIPLPHDQLVVGSKYCFVIDGDNESETDNYTVYFGEFAGGTALMHNTADGFVSLNGEVAFAYKTSTINKIVTTSSDGTIPPELLRNRVQNLGSAAVPEYRIEENAKISITLTEDATSMTTGMIGTPTDFMEIEFRILASGGGRAVTWGAMFETLFATLDTSIASGKVLRAKFQYNATRGKFGCIASNEEA